MNNDHLTVSEAWAGMDFVRIPKGTFIMGTDEEDELAFIDEFPQYSIDIPYEYWCGRFPVTNVRFGEFVRATSFITRAEQEGWC